MKFIGDKDSPSLRELNELINLAFAIWASRAHPNTLWQSCATCTFAKREGPAFCYRYQVVPPLKVIVGEEDCPGYRNATEIPF